MAKCKIKQDHRLCAPASILWIWSLNTKHHEQLQRVFGRAGSLGFQASRGQGFQCASVYLS
ncbi:hypothetical protein DV515_00008455, partial [Chloebia gouldiae]